MEGVLQHRDEGLVVGVAGDVELQHQVPGPCHHRAKMRLAALVQADEAHRHAEKAGDAEGLMVADLFQMAAYALGAHVDAKQHLREGAFPARRCGGRIDAVEEPLHEMRFFCRQPHRAFRPFEADDGLQQPAELWRRKLA